MDDEQTGSNRLSPGKRAYRTSEVLLHMDGYPTNRALRPGIKVIMHFTQDNVPDSVFVWDVSKSRDYSAFSHWSHASSHSTAPIIILFFFPLAPSFGLA
jgi:hypothetical protein